jgi:hypothetical protein
MTHAHGWAVWLTFFLGLALYQVLQLETVRRAHNNPANTWRVLLRHRGIRMAYRIFADLMVFGFIIDNPAMIGTLAEWIGWTLPKGFIDAWEEGITPWTAGISGLSLDALLSFVPGLKAIVPKLNSNDT